MVDFTFDKDILAGRIFGIRHERANPSETYVCIPPAFSIHDSQGGVWSFGTEYSLHNGEYEFNVLRNDVDMDEVAKRIEMRNGVVRIFGHYGWKHWSRNRRCFI